MKTKKLNAPLIGYLVLTLILSACASATANAEEDLGGRIWELTSMAGQPTLEDTHPSLEFNFAEMSIGGNATCNNYFGRFEVKGQALTISETGATLMACAEQDRMQQESDFFSALSQVSAYEIVNGELHLLTGDGQALVFNPK